MPRESLRVLILVALSAAWSSGAVGDDLGAPPDRPAAPTDEPREASPALAERPSIPKLPDPFRYSDGSRLTAIDEWASRRGELRDLIERHVYGPLPPKPAVVQGAFEDGKLTVTCTEGERSISFSAAIALPPNGEPPYPAIISIGRWLTLPKDVLDELGIAVVYFPNDALGRQGGARDRGQGAFYDLHGRDHPAGSLMAWAWGVSRLIDALETTPDAKIDPEKLGVTGCSRNGKGALVCGAFDERIALTIPTESGAGGSSSWRVADAMVAAGRKVQTARQIVTENTWMAPAFAAFGNHVDRLPVDQHLVMALCAPRPLLVTDNPAFEWLGPDASHAAATAARTVWAALGVPERMGFVQTSHPDHCAFKEIDELKAFCRAFLLGDPVDTNVFRTDTDPRIAPDDWIDWEVPAFTPVDN